MEPNRSVITMDDARRVLADSPFAVWWGLLVDDVGYGTATVSLPSAAHLMRPGGVLQGASYDVVADVAMWLAIMSRSGSDTPAVTIEMKTNFLRSTAANLVSTATVVHPGRRIIFGAAQTVDSAGRLVAHSTLTYALSDRSRHGLQGRPP
ncbi:MAG: PaaI family thioesterase [Actinomycetota bacterium]|nr:PaaI family thioesterase [Actinomycetota bacterium]